MSKGNECGLSFHYRLFNLQRLQDTKDIYTLCLVLFKPMGMRNIKNFLLACESISVCFNDNVSFLKITFLCRLQFVCIYYINSCLTASGFKKQKRQIVSKF